MDDWSQQGQSSQSPLLPNNNLPHESGIFTSTDLSRYITRDASGLSFSFGNEGMSAGRHASPLYHMSSGQESPVTLGTLTERSGDVNLASQYNTMDVIDKNAFMGHHVLGSRQSQPRPLLQAQSSKPPSSPEDMEQVEAIASGQAGQLGSSDSKKPQDSRYVNTMVALEKAGLLDITLKTADLIKKNDALQREIDVLEDIVKAAYALYSN